MSLMPLSLETGQSGLSQNNGFYTMRHRQRSADIKSPIDSENDLIIKRLAKFPLDIRESLLAELCRHLTDAECRELLRRIQEESA